VSADGVAELHDPAAAGAVAAQLLVFSATRAGAIGYTPMTVKYAAEPRPVVPTAPVKVFRRGWGW
jgi:hypothetical protein